MMLINCSHCHTLLQLPSGVSSMRCTICKSITYVSDFWGVPMPLGASHSLPHPSPSWGLALPPMPGGGGRKKAVICGVTYRNTRNELMGSINGAKCMKYLLINRFSFPESNIIMLTEDERDPYKIPTKHNIRMAMYWLVQGCQPGDSLVFFYSGHGSQRRDYSGEEADGYDETLCPLDFRTQGMIVDNEINATMVRPLSRGVKLLAIIDACHSGTMLDLPYLCRMNRSGHYAWEDHRPRNGAWKGTSGGEVIAFSGCDDNQTSVQTTALSGIASTGAMTYCFIQAIEQGHGTTYGSILNSMRSTIRKTVDLNSGGPVTSFITMLLTGGSMPGTLRQEPQLTSNTMFDVYAKPFSLQRGIFCLLDGVCLWVRKGFKLVILYCLSAQEEPFAPHSRNGLCCLVHES
ncbi:metacaspase-1-like isoform X2 [Musa acuminata AAA Group]|uniref:metacaspase-1-like isoform X2 n=1 Tax=Musa acuminata AAA Group TaxID=214697 RepID=UPI0031D1C5AB